MSTEQVLEERKTTHGEFSEHARVTQNLKRALQRERNWYQLPDIMKESIELICHKLGRVVTGNPYLADHWIDIQGYSKLIEQRIEDKVGLKEGHRPVDLPGGRGLGGVLRERQVVSRAATPEEVQTIIERISREIDKAADQGTEAEPTAVPSKKPPRTIIADGKPATHLGGGICGQEIPAPEEPSEHLVQRALTREDVGRHLQLCDGRRAVVDSWSEADEPYAFRLKEVLLVGSNKSEETLPPVNLFGEVENGRFNLTDVHGVWEPKPTREEQLYSKESGRANIGHPGELSSRFLCDDDIGKTVFRRDGTTGVLVGQSSKHGYTVKRTDGACYFVNKNGFMHSMDAPNAADIRQVLK